MLQGLDVSTVKDLHTTITFFIELLAFINIFLTNLTAFQTNIRFIGNTNVPPFHVVKYFFRALVVKDIS